MWREQPARIAIAILSIAIGVACALSIELVHRSALGNFAATMARIDGQAQARIEARGNAMDDAIYAQWVRSEPAAFASPVIDARFALADRPQTTLRVIGIDVFRAAEVTPALVPVPADGEARGAGSPLFSDETIFLSNAALAALDRRPGQQITLVANGEPVSLRIAGTVPGAGAGEVLAVLDLAGAQWRLGWMGRLSRIDLRFAPGVDIAATAARWRTRLPDDAVWAVPQDSAGRAVSASRAYRVNLNVLALVAWFTGAFIVWSTLALAIRRHQYSFAVLDALGAPPRWIGRFALVHGTALGIPGAVLGAACGILGAAWLLERFGADLGGGYFSADAAALRIDPLVIGAFLLAGIATGTIAALIAVWQPLRRPAARRLQIDAAADDDPGIPTGRQWRFPVSALVLGALLLLVPPLGEIPWAAYIAIGSWIAAAIALLAPIIRIISRQARRLTDSATFPSVWLAAERLAGASGPAAASCAPIVVSFALTVAMIAMVSSFRNSFDAWLDQRLPADAYGRIVGDADGAALDAAMQQKIASAAGVARAEFSRAVVWKLDPARPPATILVRPLDHESARSRLTTVGAVHAVPPGTIGIFASEAMADLYGFRVGTTQTAPLPLGAAHRPRSAKKAAAAAVAGADAAPADSAPTSLFVAGIVRDYAHQHGSIVIDAAAWQRLGGDARASQAAVWFDRPAQPGPDWSALQAATAALTGFEWRDGGAVRARALQMFDRSFAITRALEAIAIAVALFGAASIWASEGIARRREFALLACLGLTRAQIRRSFTVQAASSLAIALAWGTIIGLLIALVLIERVNPQSFHWTMDLHWPGSVVLLAALTVLIAGIVTAALTVGAMPVRPEHALQEEA